MASSYGSKAFTLAVTGDNVDALAKLQEIDDRVEELQVQADEEGIDLDLKLVNRVANQERMKVIRDSLQAEADEEPVELPVTADTEEAEAATTELDDALTKYKASVETAVAAQEQLNAVQKDSSASAGQLSAAQAELTASTKALKDAQTELGAAELGSSDDAAVAAAKQEEAAGAAKVSAAAATEASTAWEGMGTKLLLAGGGLAVVGGIFTDMAAKFQDSTTHLVTDAGESQKNLAMVQQGILNVASATGTSADSVTDAMYHIESGGFHGASGLALLTTAAEGAKVGGADLDTVSRVLVGTMNAYGMSSKNAATQQKMANQMMNEMIATVGAGDMKMQDLASSMSAVTPLAASVGIKFSQVGGAIATMTAQGMSANQSTQDLANTIRSLSNPNQTAIKEMNQLGINATNVQKNLGKEGLTGTLEGISDTILKQMGPSGTVLLNAFQQSTTAGSDMQEMLNNMSPSVAALAKQYSAGTITSYNWTQALKNESGANANLLTQYATLYKSSTSFNAELKAGGPAAQTYQAALAKVMGGATGLNTALMLTGTHTATFNANVKTVQEAADKTGNSVNNWSTIQGTLSFQLDKAKTSVEDMGIGIGMKLLPPVTFVIKYLAEFVSWLAKYPDLVGGAIVVIVALAAAFGGMKVVLGVKAMFESVGETISTFKETMEGLPEVLGKAKAAMMGLNESFLANPIVLVVVAIVALIAIFAVLWIKCAAFRDFWKDVWRDIKIAAKDVWDWIKDNWPLILGFLTGPIGFAAAFVLTHWDAIANGAKSMYDKIVTWIKDVPVKIVEQFARANVLLFDAGVNIIKGLINGIGSMVGSVISKVTGIGSDISGAFKSVLGIHSPSVVFQGHGSDIVKGLVLGIEHGAPQANTAARTLASGVASSAAYGASSYGARAGNGQTVVQLEFIGDVDATMVTALKKLIRVRGGNPAVLGM